MEYEVSLVFGASNSLTIDAETPEEAVGKAYDSEEASPGLCHQCASEVELGDLIRVIVFDEDGNEVFDDGFENAAIIQLGEKVQKQAEALETVRSKVYSATICHPNGVQFLLEEALAAIDEVMKGKQ